MERLRHAPHPPATGIHGSQDKTCSTAGLTSPPALIVDKARSRNGSHAFALTAPGWMPNCCAGIAFMQQGAQACLRAMKRMRPRKHVDSKNQMAPPGPLSQNGIVLVLVKSALEKLTCADTEQAHTAALVYTYAIIDIVTKNFMLSSEDRDQSMLSALQAIKAVMTLPDNFSVPQSGSSNVYRCQAAAWACADFIRHASAVCGDEGVAGEGCLHSSIT